MSPANNPGRVVGLLMLAQATCGALMFGPLLRPVLAAPGFLANAAPHAFNVGVAAMLGLLGGALSIGMVVAAWPMLRDASRAMALWLLALGAAGLALAAAENSALLTMLSLSQEYTRAGVDAAARFDVAALAVRSLRYWAHYMKLIVGAAMFALLLATLLRHALLPRLLAGLALAATLLQLVSVTLPVFGQRMQFALLMPAALMYLLVAGWLLWRGFSAPRAPLHAAAAQPG